MHLSRETDSGPNYREASGLSARQSVGQNSLQTCLPVELPPHSLFGAPDAEFGQLVPEVAPRKAQPASCLRLSAAGRLQST